MKIKSENRYKTIAYNKGDGKNVLPHFYFPDFDSEGKTVQFCSTRLGGVSEGVFDSMNLSFTRGDDVTRVMENYRRVANTLGCELWDITLTYQTHTTNIKVLTETDRGKGVARDRDYRDIDGLITNVKGMAIGAYFADCVPLIFYDPVKEVIGLAHSGWRGTVGNIGGKMIAKMCDTFDCKIGDIRVGIGTSICEDCYEIGEEVAKEFAIAYGLKLEELPVYEEVRQYDSEIPMKELAIANGDGGYFIPSGVDEAIVLGYETSSNILWRTTREGKYQLNLWQANIENFLNAGVKPENINVTNVCTRCNPDVLFSHRITGNKRGNLAAFIMLKR